MRSIPVFVFVVLAVGIGSVEAATKQTNAIHARAVAVFAPRPDYPYKARRARITGSGVAILQVDAVTGKVTSCQMAPSTGSVVLDAAALDAFRQWRFTPGTIKEVRIPITFGGGRV